MNNNVEKESGLSSKRLQLLEMILKKKGIRTSQPQVIRRRSERGPCPLSFAQQRLWFLDQMEPGSPAYNIPVAVRLTGALDARALEMAISEIIRRHESLRTTFDVTGGQPVQIIRDAQAFTLPTVDLREMPDGRRESEISRLIAQEAALAFDLVRGPLMRTTLVRLDENDHIILSTKHHIISDGWSTAIFVKELAALYEAFSTGSESPLDELPVQYADFARWQREWLEGSEMETQLEYWKRRLGGSAGLLELPADRPRPAVQSFRGARRPFIVPEDVSHSLKVLSQREGATLFMTLLAAFQVLLYRYTGNKDVSVGSPIASRNRQEIEGLIGFFANTLVFRTELSGGQTFREVLRRVRDLALEAYANQDVPFEKIVEALQPERSLSHTPFFQVMFVLQNNSRERLQAPGLSFTPLRVPGVTAKFDLTLLMNDQQERLLGSLEYNTDLFEAATVDRLVESFQMMLARIAESPDLSISSLPIISDAERHRLLVELNATALDYPNDACLHHLIEAQVERTPDSTAARCGGRSISYREMNRRANRVANYLTGVGVKTETRVGILMERSIEMLVALLGVLKAGATYVPLDPAYPRERLAFIIEDAELSLVLTDKAMASVAQSHQVKTARVDSESESLAEASDENPAARVSAENLAYIIYTSGSTGRPKGVMIHHQGLVNYLLNWCLDAYGVREGRGAVVHSSISFDLSVTGLFAPLLAGREVVLVPDSEGIEGLGMTLKREGEFSLIKITPAHLELLSKQLSPEEAAWRTRAFVIGGEALPPESLAFWQKHAPDTLLFNEYGPTETVVGCCVYSVPRDEAKPSSIPIGRPIPNTQLYILDEQLEPAPVGVTGEFYIGGDGLARGYLNQQATTAEKFIPNPFSKRPGARLYKTGDVARYLADGNIEFLGRIDDQVKIRGYRVELGEIESVLSRREGVREAVVMMREDVIGDKRLVAYVVFDQQTPPSLDELRGHLESQLPRYMIPSAIVAIDTLPLTSNGKVDRRALPAPDRQAHADAAAVAPRTPVEEMLADIWAKVLNREPVGVTDNFFALGGHSMLAAQVISRVREVFRIELPLRKIFESATIAELARSIEDEQADSGAQVLPVTPISREGELPLSFGQQRLWFLNQIEPDSPSYNMHAAFRLRGPLDITSLERAFNEVVRRHEILRTTFPIVDGVPVQVISPTSSFSLRVVDLASDAEVEQTATEEIRRPFDLKSGPLVRVALLRLSDQDHCVIATMHHIVSDGWSIGIFMHEVVALYEAFYNDRPSPLADLPIQYADFAHWQRQWSRGERMEAQLAYWKRHLGGTLPQLKLPVDRPRETNPSSDGARESRAMAADLLNGLRQLSRQENSTLFMVLMAAFQTLLHRYSGQSDIIIGSPIGNRPRVETEGLIGCFLNTLAIRTDLSGNPTFREALARVREVTLGAYAHQDMPFDQLVAALQPERTADRVPMFQVTFALQNTPRLQITHVPGLTLEPLRIDVGAAQFDLTLLVSESDQGLNATLVYRSDLFEGSTIKRMLEHFETLLRSIVDQPDERLNALDLSSEAERRQRAVEDKQREEYKRNKFMSIKPKALGSPRASTVKVGTLSDGETLPLVIEPAVEGLDVTNWAKSNWQFIQTKLAAHGGVLFRNFGISTAADFEQFVNAVFSHLLEYRERSTPRTEVAKYIYTSTEYPAEQSIALHNEFSYARSWPMKIAFFCAEAAEQGGETPIADMRKVFRLLSPEIRDRFIQKQVMYVRNYGSGIDLHWQNVFQTTDRAEVERYCRNAPIEFEWLSGDGLRTRQVRPAVMQHPSGDWVWFNQAHLFHTSNLESEVRESLLATFAPEDLPRNACYGDGSSIEDSVLDEVRAAIQKATVSFPWRKGDLLLLDNMLIAHGRAPYAGPRRVLVAMAEPSTANAA